MRAGSTLRIGLAGLVALALVTGCAVPGPGGRTPAAGNTQPGAQPTSQPTLSATATTTATPASVSERDNIEYEPGRSELLDVYAPTATGPWPVVVMFHGSPPVNTKSTVGTWARLVARLGFVVFAPSWGHNTQNPPDAADLQTDLGQVACAIAFARSKAADFGGDAQRMIVFGQSAGASITGSAAFARPTPESGCRGGSDLGPIADLVVFDGDWLAADPVWDEALAADPAVFDLYTPWKHVAEHPELPVFMLTAEHSGDYSRPLPDRAAVDAFFAQRDPSGELRAQVESLGLLADGTIGIPDLQALMFSALKAQGNPTTLDLMPDSSHDMVTGRGVGVFLGVFERLASK